MKRIQLFIIALVFLGQTEWAQSPYKISWEKDGLIMGTAAAAASVGAVVYYSVPALTQQEVNGLSRKSINGFDRGATYNYSGNMAQSSDILLGASMAAPLLMLFEDGPGRDWKTLSLMYIETITFAATIPSLGKGAVQRFRPFVYNPDLSFNTKESHDPKRSFFSGHTSMAFASAVFLSTTFSEYYPHSPARTYIWIGSLTLAGAVGYLRYASGMHYPSDILTGAVVGSGIGYIIPYLHKTGNAKLSVSPIIFGPSQGFALSLRF